MAVISYAEAQTLTIARLEAKLARLPFSAHSQPSVMLYDPVAMMTKAYSYEVLLAQVKMNTPVGQQYVNMQMQELDNVIQ